MKGKGVCLGVLWLAAAARGQAVRMPRGRAFTNSIGIRLVRIEPGRFLMGCRERTHGMPNVSGGGVIPTPSAGNYDEYPVHPVRISRAFYMGVSEVTLEQYRRFDANWQTQAALANGRKAPRGGDGYDGPWVVGLSWEDARAFCDWLSRKEELPYRLPTEAEWEYACRAGSDGWFHSGREPPGVGQANAWGLENMHAGPGEWCADFYGPYPSAEQTDPVGPSAGFVRVVRGGGVVQGRHAPSSFYRRSANRAGLPAGLRSTKPVGFRVVLGDPPPTTPRAPEPPLAMRWVKQGTAARARAGPEPARPWFRARPIHPVPMDAGRHSPFAGYNHSPALAVCPNGDLLALYYDGRQVEYGPAVFLAGMRLRFGAEEWDRPCVFLSIPDINDHAPLLWNDGSALRLFWGHDLEGSPFRWTASPDSGATWGPIRVVVPTGRVGGYSSQPISTAFRDGDGAMYVSCDGSGGRSLLWVSTDDGRTWADTGGRTLGRHSSFVRLDDGRFFALGGKNAQRDGRQPKNVSTDKGRTWTAAGSIFPVCGGGQRPVLIRLASGRLFVACDYKPSFYRDRRPPQRIADLGIRADEAACFVTLSDDGGRTWSRWRRLPGVRSLGYAAARQGPNGLIHLITSKGRPCVHFEMNEAWILSGGPPASAPASGPIGAAKPVRHEEKWPDGTVRAAWSGLVAPDGRFLLHGTETWYDRTGRTQWQAAWQGGRKVGAETCWAPDDRVRWRWRHDPDGTKVETRYHDNGRVGLRASWKSGRLLSVTHYDGQGRAIPPPARADLWSVEQDLRPGRVAYGDRWYVYEKLPADLVGAEYVRPANDSMSGRADPLATFTVRSDARVVVAHDPRGRRPEWLGSWRPTGRQLLAGRVRFNLYERRFAAGQEVRLGPLGLDTGCAMYLVIVAPARPGGARRLVADLEAHDRPAAP